MGPFQAREMLREALAMGADAAYLITDRAFAASDTWATSSILAAAISKLDYDLIITGRQAIDGDTAQVGLKPLNIWASPTSAMPRKSTWMVIRLWSNASLRTTRISYARSSCAHHRLG